MDASSDLGESKRKGKSVIVEEDYVGLDKLAEGFNFAVKVMICRKWDATNSFGKYLGTEFIVSDAEGNIVQVSARSNIAHRFIGKLQEGCVYSLQNFSVVRNKEKFRVRRNDQYTISLEGYTVVKKMTCEPGTFSRFPFELIPLEEVEVNDSAYLIDVIGFVADVGQLRTTRGGAELIEFEIMNERETRMRVTLWSPLCSEILKRKGSAAGPYVIILPSMNVKEYRGETYLSNTSATVLFDAPDIPQIAALLSALSETNIASNPVKPAQPAAIVVSVYQLLQAGREQKDSGTKSCTFHLKVRVINVRTKDGWFYFSCGLGGCKKRVMRSGSKFMCQTCNKVCEFPRASYRLHLSVGDSTGTVVVTMFDDVASRLIGRTAAQLLAETEDDGDENVLPAPILSLYNSQQTLEVKSHTYYDQGTYESFTVTSVVDAPPDKLLPLKRSIDELSDPNIDPKKASISGLLTSVSEEEAVVGATIPVPKIEMPDAQKDNTRGV